jgi:hypothetical protein
MVGRIEGSALPDFSRGDIGASVGVLGYTTVYRIESSVRQAT